MTRRPLIAAALLAVATAASAQDTAPQDETPQGELDRMERSAREALKALQDGLAPYLESLGDAIGALDDYGPPEILPNGDILIPRKRPEDAPPAPGEQDGEPDTLDL